MKPFRLLLVAAGVLVLVVVAVVAIGFSTSFQTWAARKALNSQPGIRATVGSVSAGWSRLDVKDLRIERDGVVISIPAVDGGVSAFSLLRKKVVVSRLVAKGWTLDLSQPAPRSVLGSGGAGPATPAAGAAPPTDRPATEPRSGTAFTGVFNRLHLPIDVAVESVDLEGLVVLPESRGRIRVALKGGGIAAKREGKLDLHASAELQDPSVSAVDIRGEILAAMDTPRTFTRLTAKLNASARGTQFPNGVKLSAEIGATRANGREAYAVALVNDGGELLTAHAEFPPGAQRLEGTWKVDLRDADVAPFALGRPLPAFTAVGEGKFDTEATFSAVHASGRLNATADRLQILKPELAAIGELKLAADFDVAQQAGSFVVQKFEAAIDGAQPVARVRTLQPFEFTPRTGQLRATDAGRELLAVALEGVPLAWMKPFLKDISVEGGSVRGALAATARGGGMTLRSTSPMTINGVSIVHAGKPVGERLDVAVNIAGDYTPQGWQAELGALTLESGGTLLARLDAKAGQLTGTEQLKSTGRVTLHLAPLLKQPAAMGAALLTDGQATVDFVAGLGRKQELHAKFSLTELATVAGDKPLKLPSLHADIRADIAEDGTITFNAPTFLQSAARKSDLLLAGTIGSAKDNVRAIEARVTSANLVVDDAKVFAQMMPEKSVAAADPTASEAKRRAPWEGITGSVVLQLKRVVYSDTFEVTDVAGRVQIDAGVLKLESLRAGLGEHGRANVRGAVSFDGKSAQPFAVVADVVVREFDPAPLFRARNRDEPPTLEGKFDVSSKLTSRGATMGALALGAGGDFHLTSKGGVFRGLPVNVSKVVESTGKIAGIIATAGSAIGLTGRKDGTEVANKAQAVNELAKGLNPIPFDQLSVVLSRDAALNTTLKDFSLISPELRLTGSGTVLHREGGSLLENSLAMEFRLRARGRQGDLLKYLGALEPQTDDLGYAACTVPLKITGSLGKPDTGELNGRLVALALEKSGVTEKASELLNRVFGSGGK